MKAIPKTKEQILKENESLRKNAIKAGLDHIGDDIYADYNVCPTQYYRFGFIRSVKNIKEAIKERNEGNIQSYSVQMKDFEDLIPREVLTVLVNREVESILKKRVKKEMAKLGLSTTTPENIYDAERDCPDTSYSYGDIDEGYSFDMSKWDL